MIGLARQAVLTLLNVADGQGWSQLLIDEYGRLRGVTVDEGLALAAAGTITGAASATSPWSSQVTAGYLTLSAPPSNVSPVYYGLTGVASATGLPIWPGQSRTVRLTNPALSYAYVSSNDSCGWAVER